jgi:hypothetical protein
MKHFLGMLASVERVFKTIPYICGRVVKEKVEDDGKRIYNDTKDVAPSPLEFGIEV